MNKEEKVIQIAQLVEEAEQENLKNIFIPILDGFEPTPDSDNNKMVAIKDNVLEQFYNDGVLKDGETLESKIKENQENTFESLPNKELYDEDSFKYFKDYSTDFFSFKIYAQDILVGMGQDLYFIRQLNGYFLNPTTNEFCQVSLAAGRYKVDGEYKLLKDIEDLEKDSITMSLYNSLLIIMDNIKFEQ